MKREKELCAGEKMPAKERNESWASSRWRLKAPTRRRLHSSHRHSNVKSTFAPLRIVIRSAPTSLRARGTQLSQRRFRAPLFSLLFSPLGAARHPLIKEENASDFYCIINNFFHARYLFPSFILLHVFFIFKRDASTNGIVFDFDKLTNEILLFIIYTWFSIY